MLWSRISYSRITLLHNRSFMQLSSDKDIDGLVQERRNSSVLAMELHLFYTHWLVWYWAEFQIPNTSCSFYSWAFYGLSSVNIVQNIVYHTVFKEIVTPHSSLVQYVILQVCRYGMAIHFNWMWPSDTIQQYRSWSTLAQVMACCLMVPRPLLELMLTFYMWGSEAFTWELFRQDWKLELPNFYSV